MLTLLTPSRGFTLAGSWTTTTSDLLAVRALVVGERGENRGETLLGRE